jgi:hypothetical protein
VTVDGSRLPLQTQADGTVLLALHARNEYVVSFADAAK